MGPFLKYCREMCFQAKFLNRTKKCVSKHGNFHAKMGPKKSVYRGVFDKVLHCVTEFYVSLQIFTMFDNVLHLITFFNTRTIHAITNFNNI